MPRKDLEKAIEVVNDLQTSLPTISLNTYEGIVKLSVEGAGMAQQPGIAAKVFSIMAQQNIRIMAITTSETKISYIIHPLMKEGSCDVLILDEIMGVIHGGLVSVEQVCRLIDNKPRGMELILTGRDVPRAIADRADLITEMRNVKHYMDKGVPARKGIEY